MFLGTLKQSAKARVVFLAVVAAGPVFSGVTAAAQEAKTLPRNPSAQNLLEQAKDLIRENKRNAALAALEEAVRIEPGWGELYLQQGRIYVEKFGGRKDPEYEQKAMAALQQAGMLDPSLAGEVYLQQALLDSRRERYEDAIANFERGLKVDPTRLGAYYGRWMAMLKLPEFEQEIPKIREEIENLLYRGTLSAGEISVSQSVALQAAMGGYEILGDEDSQRKTEDLFMARFPEHEQTGNILSLRVFLEKDAKYQATMAEIVLERFPEIPNAGGLAQILFRYRASRLDEPNDRLIKVGEEWVRLAARTPQVRLRALLNVGVVFTERNVALDRAQALIDEAVEIADGITPESGLPEDMEADARASLLESRKKSVLLTRMQARAVRGFVLLRRGRLDKAATEFSTSLQTVIEEVEREGFSTVEKDLRASLSRGSVRTTPVLWLAELYEAQEDYERASRFLLAGWYEGSELARQYIRARMPIVYEAMGHGAAEADRVLMEAEERLRSAASAVKKVKQEKILSDRVGEPAPDFPFVTLDKQQVRLSDLKGKVVVLNFWATWCGPCLLEMPHLQAVVNSYTDNPGVVFLAVSVDENRAPVRPFIEKNGYTMTVVYGSEAAEDYKVLGIPQTVLIDRNGVIQYVKRGFGGTGEEWINGLTLLVEELLSSTGR